MEFQKIVEKILDEDMTAGGVGSVLGPNADQSYEQNTKGDARNVFAYSGIMTRKGMRRNSKGKKNRKKLN